MHSAGLPWDATLTTPLRESLSIIEHQMDRDMVAAHRHNEQVWASIAPHVTNKMEAPELPDFTE